MRTLNPPRDLSARRSAHRRPGFRLGVAALAAALGVATLQAPAHAAEPKPTTGLGDVSITSALTVAPGGTVSFSGSGFALQDGVGQTLSIKVDDGAVSKTGQTEGVFGTVKVGTDGTFAGSVTLPEGFGTGVDKIDAGQHWLRFLGAAPVTSRISERFTVVEKLSTTLTATATTSAAGAASIAIAGTALTRGEKVTATVDGAPATFTIGSGSSAKTAAEVVVDDNGAISSTKIAYTAPPTTTGTADGSLRSGKHTVVLTRSSQPSTPITEEITVLPGVAWSNLARGKLGVLTLTNLPASARISGADLATVSFGTPVTASSSGQAYLPYSIPVDAKLGSQTATIRQAATTSGTTTIAATDYTLTAKISPSNDEYNVDKFSVTTTEPGAIQQGLYQSAYSASSKSLFVTSASGTSTSTIYKLDPDTLAIKASVVPAFVTGTSGALWAAYGIGVDDANGTVWVTNTRQNTIAVYKQSDLSLVKQLVPASSSEPVVNHSRDVIVDKAGKYAYVTAAARGSNTGGVVEVFDAKTYEPVKEIALTGVAVSMSLALDGTTGKVYTVDLNSATAEEIDPANNFAVRAIDLGDNVSSASGVDIDPTTGRLFVANQATDNLTVVNIATGAKLADVAVGAGALNVAWDPAKKLAYVSSLSGGTVSVVNNTYTLVGRIPFARANHVETDGLGNAYAVNKDTNNQVMKISPKVDLNATTTVPTTPAPTTAPASPAPTTAAPTTAAPSATTPGTLTWARPKITGTVKVGKTLKVKVGTWTAGTKFSYVWYVNGKKVSTKSTLKIKKAWKGKKIKVKVTGTKAGFTSASATSATTAKVKK